MKKVVSTAAMARLAMTLIVLYQLLLIVLIFLRPDLAPSWHSISEWAIGPYGWLMTSAFFVSAIYYLSYRWVPASPFLGRRITRSSGVLFSPDGGGYDAATRSKAGTFL